MDPGGEDEFKRFVPEREGIPVFYNKEPVIVIFETIFEDILTFFLVTAFALGNVSKSMAVSPNDPVWMVDDDIINRTYPESD